MEHIESLGALVTGEHVAHGIVAHMAHVDAPRGIGEHLQHIGLRGAKIVAGCEDAGLIPGRLPVPFAVGRVVAFGCHRAVADLSGEW